VRAQGALEEEVEMAGDSGESTIQSIDRAAAVLGLFDQETRRLTPPLVAERLGFDRTTAYRYLQSLHRSGFLDADYALGSLVDQLSAFSSGRQRILGLAPAIMRRLTEQTGLTSVLSFLGRTGAVVTLVEEATAGTIIITVPTGAVLEPRAAQTRVLLAFQSDAAVVLRLHGDLSAAEVDEELAELAKVRRDRLAWADLRRVGLASVAVPVFGSRDVQAAMALLGTTATLSAAPDGPVAALGEAAEKLGDLVTG
jgi:DNA-binding IclR family transcriptional regulator